MEFNEALSAKLQSINGKDYGAYQSLIGTYRYSRFKLIIDRIPKDPYAPPHTGIYRIQVKNLFADPLIRTADVKTAEIAFRDFLARSFYRAAVIKSKGRRGTGYSGIITIAKPEQVILERNSVCLQGDSIEVRFFIGLPADGRNINSQICREMLFEELPEIVELALFPQNIDPNLLEKHLQTALDAGYLRSRLDSLGLVAFIADNSILPRSSGSSDQPLDKNSAIPFKSPESMRVEIDLPWSGRTVGMGIPRGITLIVGGGYHGKSTLLNAIEMGIYDHVPGDGREKCIADSRAVKIRAYSGRNIEKVDISTFIDTLPFQQSTARFSTENASGSTSQAAGISEALEAGAQVLLMDEDTCATNFMIRDRKMQKLVLKEDEPITPFIDNVEGLYSTRDVSTILVLGGTGDYFAVSTRVIQMKNYLPLDVTRQAHEIHRSTAEQRRQESKNIPAYFSPRTPRENCIDPRNEYGKESIYSTEIDRIHFGKNAIDLTDVEQLIELSQTKAIAAAIGYSKKYMNGKRTLAQIIQKIMDDIEKNGLDVLSDKLTGHFARFRGLELAQAINRLRDLKMVDSSTVLGNHS